jgi:hypothetical protein
MPNQKDHVLSHYQKLVQYDDTRSYVDLPAIQLVGKSSTLKEIEVPTDRLIKLHGCYTHTLHTYASFLRIQPRSIRYRSAFRDIRFTISSTSALYNDTERL